MDSAWTEWLLEAVNSIKRMKQRANNDRISRYLKRYDATDSAELAHQIELAVKHGILVELRNADDIAYVDPKQNPTIKNQAKLTPDDEKQLFRELMRAVQTLTRSRKRSRPNLKKTMPISKESDSVNDSATFHPNSPDLKHPSKGLVVEGVPLEAIEQHLRARFQLKIENGVFRQKLNSTLSEALEKGFLDKCEGKFVCTGKSPSGCRSGKSSTAKEPKPVKSMSRPLALLDSNYSEQCAAELCSKEAGVSTLSSNLKEEASISRLSGVKKEEAEVIAASSRSCMKSTPSRCFPKQSQASSPRSSKQLAKLTPRSRRKSQPSSPPEIVALRELSSPRSTNASRQRKKTSKYSPPASFSSNAKVKYEVDMKAAELESALSACSASTCDKTLALSAASGGGVTSVTRIRLKKPTKPIMVCSFCLGDENLNKKTGLVEPMMSCADCGRSGHPTCMCWSEKLYTEARRLRWQCMECKQCSRCGRVSKKDTNLLLCDGCDRGFHMQCAEPPLTRLPKGLWHCNICDPERAGLRLSIFEDELGAPIMPEELTDGLTLFYTPSNKRHSRVSSNSFMQKHYVMNENHRRAPRKDRPVVANNKSAGQQAAAKLLQKVKKRGTTAAAAAASPPDKPRRRTCPIKIKGAATIVSRTKEKRRAEESGEVKSKRRRRTAAEMKLEENTSMPTTADTLKKKKPAPAPPPVPVLNLTDEEVREAVAECMAKELARAQPTVTPEDDKLYASAQARTREEMARLVASSNLPMRAAAAASMSTADEAAEDNSNSCSSFQTEAALSCTLPAQLNAADANVQCERYPPIIEIGTFEIETWYSAPYPQEYARLPKLYICEFCLKYLKTKNMLQRHVKKCELNHPPSTEIYRNNNLSVFEVNGQESKLYCQNLCLLAKLFLDHKTLYYDVEPFLFYVLTVNDINGCHIVGYFSKEKRSAQCYNVSCIMTLPCYQQCGYGRFLIDFSYLLSRIEGESGSPEKPLSELGRLSYHSYWRSVIFEWLDARNDSQRNTFCIQDLCKDTGLDPHDVSGTLARLGMLEMKTQESSGCAICVNRSQLAAYMAQTAKKRAERIFLCERSLRWTPLVSGTSYQDADTSAELDATSSTSQGEEDEEDMSRDVCPATPEQKLIVLDVPQAPSTSKRFSAKKRVNKACSKTDHVLPPMNASTPRTAQKKSKAKELLSNAVPEKRVAKRRGYSKHVAVVVDASSTEVPSTSQSLSLIVDNTVEEERIVMKDEEGRFHHNHDAASNGYKPVVSPNTDCIREDDSGDRDEGRLHVECKSTLDNLNAPDVLKEEVENMQIGECCSSSSTVLEAADEIDLDRTAMRSSAQRSSGRRCKAKRGKSNKGLVRRSREESAVVAAASFEKRRSEEADCSFQLEEDITPRILEREKDEQVKDETWKVEVEESDAKLTDCASPVVLTEREGVACDKEEACSADDMINRINQCGEDKTDGHMDSSDATFFNHLSDSDSAELPSLAETCKSSSAGNIALSIETENSSCVERGGQSVSDSFDTYRSSDNDGSATCSQQVQASMSETIYPSQSLDNLSKARQNVMPQELPSLAQMQPVRNFYEMQSVDPNPRPPCLSPNERYATRQPKHYEYLQSQLPPLPSPAAAAVQGYYRNSTPPSANYSVYNNAPDSHFGWHPSRQLYPPPPHLPPPAQMHQQHQMQHHVHNEMQQQQHNMHADAYSFQQMQQQSYPHPPINYPPMYGAYHPMESDPYALPPNAPNYYQLHDQPFYPMQRYPSHHGSAYSSALPH